MIERWILIGASLVVATSCDDVTLDIGPLADLDPCSDRDPNVCSAEVQGSATFTRDGRTTVMLPPRTAILTESLVSLVLGGGDQDEVDIRIWSPAPGRFNCEDPRAAGLTRIDMTDFPQERYWSSVFGGACEITLVRFPTLGDPTLGGTFTVRFVIYGQYGYPIPDVTASGNFTIADVKRFH